MSTNIEISFDSSNQDDIATWRLERTEAVSPAAAAQILAESAAEIQAVVTTHGALRIIGLHGLRTAADFNSAITAVTPNLRDYVGGTSPRTRAHGRIMTATYTPATWSIILHQEMAYTAEPPSYISFFCEKPAPLGGDSTFGKMRRVLTLVKPEVRARLESNGLKLCRTLPSERTVHLKPGVKKPWNEVFETTNKAEVERVVESKGWECDWIDGESLRLWQELVPAIRPHPLTGESVWCNQAHFFNPRCMAKWAEEDGRAEDAEELYRAIDENPELLDRMYLGSGEPVADDDALHIYDVLRSIEQSVRLERSDVLILDNLLVSHGRTIVHGERSILVALADR